MISVGIFVYYFLHENTLGICNQLVKYRNSARTVNITLFSHVWQFASMTALIKLRSDREFMPIIIIYQERGNGEAFTVDLCEIL